MKAYKWRTIATAVYSDSATGSDSMGDGTMTNPYQSLRRAYNSGSTKPTLIICRGYFSEDMADGNHACTIQGDYMGAAVFDGGNTYLIYGFGHANLIIQNCPFGSTSFTVWTGSGLFAGAGRANTANGVGSANVVLGVAGSPVILDNTGLYWGVAGGTTAVSYCVFSRLRCNSTYLISLGGYSGQNPQHNTYYGVAIANRRKKLTTDNITIYASAFGAWDMFCDDAGVIFDGCLFASDSKWYYGATEIVITGTTSAAREASLIAGMDAAGILTANRVVFVNCKFSTQTSTQIFNNPTKLDFTLKMNSDGIINPGIYYGAMGVALDVPILTDSTGVPASWDENSASGCIDVYNNAICIDENSASLTGEILSKVIGVNPTEVSIESIFAAFTSKFRGYHAYLSSVTGTGVEYAEGASLPVGRYIVNGSIIYNSVNLGDNSICVVLATGTSFTDASSGSKLLAIEDPNVTDVVYIRETAMAYARILATDGLQAGGTYLNTGAESIVYRGRTIVHGESFVAENSTDTFTASAGYTIGVMFDDTRVPSSVWIPAQLFGAYFVWKASGVIQYDTSGVPISSGNYLSYQTTANGGYSNTLVKSTMTKAYFQFKIMCKKYR